MSVSRLALTDFRSYAHADIAPGPGFVVLTGENGAGKTNVLEAISLLAPGRGLRGADNGALARRDGAGGFAVSARVGGVQLGTGVDPGAPTRRVARINGAAAAVGAFADWLSVVWLTPALDRLFTDAPADRRRFLDRLVLALEPVHARHTTRYEAAMRQRNRLLADGRADPRWLDALEAAMAEHGTEVAAARARLVDALEARMAEAQDDSFARASLRLDGWDEEDLAKVLRAGRARDAAAGRTLAGPHRQDLLVTHRARAMPADACSTGEQKALLIGIVLAHTGLVAERVGRAPVLLLDEVAAHLDVRRRAALFARLDAMRCQTWLTGTDAAIFDTLPASATRYRVVDGAIALS